MGNKLILNLHTPTLSPNGNPIYITVSQLHCTFLVPDVNNTVRWDAADQHDTFQPQLQSMAISDQPTSTPNSSTILYLYDTSIFLEERVFGDKSVTVLEKKTSKLTEKCNRNGKRWISWQS